VAEIAGQPPSGDAGDALSKRITDYFNSPEGRKHFLEGFVSKSDAYKLAEIAQRESRRYRFPPEQVGLPQRSPSSEEMMFRNQVCQEVGHNWELSSGTFAFECSRCGLMKMGPNGAGNWPGATPEEEVDPDEPDEADLALMCLWCGKLCADHDALDLHEDECAP
jgi:hypothetical protein